ncbi:MAG: hypothetical protein OCD01_04020 [Fibrobacterales bacterium]
MSFTGSSFHGLFITRFNRSGCGEILLEDSGKGSDDKKGVVLDGGDDDDEMEDDGYIEDEEMGGITLDEELKGGITCELERVVINESLLDRVSGRVEEEGTRVGVWGMFDESDTIIVEDDSSERVSIVCNSSTQLEKKILSTVRLIDMTEWVCIVVP